MATDTTTQTRANPEIELDFSALDRLPTGKDLPFDDDAEPVALRNMPGAKDLPYDDGEPMESAWHRDQMVLLIDSVGEHWRDRTDFYVGGNMFVYYSPERVFNKDFRGPDFFVVHGVERDRPRVSWVAWEENGRLPDLIVELISPTTAAIDRGEKKRLYGALRTGEYFCYDPLADRLEGWRLTSLNGYAPIPAEPDGRMWCQQLGAFLGRWDGRYLETTGRFLRLFSPGGSLVPTGPEALARAARAEAARASSEAQRAASEADARQAAEARAAAEASARTAAETEVERLKQELAALRGQLPPNTP